MALFAPPARQSVHVHSPEKVDLEETPVISLVPSRTATHVRLRTCHGKAEGLVPIRDRRCLNGIPKISAMKIGIGPVDLERFQMTDCNPRFGVSS